MGRKAVMGKRSPYLFPCYIPFLSLLPYVVICGKHALSPPKWVVNQPFGSNSSTICVAQRRILRNFALYIINKQRKIMKKRLLTLTWMALALTCAKANVVINSTNFPDENFRAQVAEAFDSDGDGTISDEEMEANGGHHNFDRVSNLKGIELLTSITELQIINYPDEPGLTTFDYELPNLHWLEFQDQVGSLTTVDATKCTNLEDFGVIENPAGLSTLKLPSSLKSLNLCYAPLVKTFDPKQFPNLQTMSLLGNTGITDLDFSNHKSIQNISVVGYDEPYQLNSLNMVNCPELTNIDIKVCTIKSLTFKSLPEMLSILVYESDITNMLVDDLSQLGSIEAHNNVLGTLTLNNLPAIYGLSCESNKLQTLIIDKCPGMNGINAEHNRLMWLDLQDVKKNGTDENSLKIDDQQPTVQAVKISPTETGLLVHERFDVSRVLNLRAKGIAQTPRETTVDDIRYFVFYDNGPDTPNLVGSDCYYEYETKWPYAWMEENSKDNNLPVALQVTSWTKHQAFLTLSESAVRGKYAEPAPAAPTVTRSQDYDGKITFSSSNENVVRVNPDTGELTVVGAGTAIISVKGAETDYRLAPVTKTYTVIIEKASPVFAFEKAAVEAEVGKAAPENKLTIQMYDGTVQYSSSNEEIATVDQNGVVTAKAEGEVTITAIGPATSNCNEAQKATYTLTVKEEGAGISAIDNGQLIIDNYFDLRGHSIKASTARKGVYILGKKKIVKK